jgi:rubrerythrin
MMKMNSTHSSKAVVLGVLLAVAFAAVGTAGAITISGFSDAPESAQVGQEVTVEAELTELYGDEVPDDDWILSGETELEDPDWTVIVRDAGGAEVARTDATNETFNQVIEREANHVRVEVSITGSVPEMSEFNYEETSVEEAVAMELSQLTESGDASELPDGTHTVQRYNEDSQAARQAIDSAMEAAEEADNDDARDRVDDAITFYNNGEFESAIDAADDAESTAQGAEQTQQLLLIGGAVVVVVAILGGGLYYWRQNQQDTSKLR